MPLFLASSAVSVSSGEGRQRPVSPASGRRFDPQQRQVQTQQLKNERGPKLPPPPRQHSSRRGSGGGGGGGSRNAFKRQGKYYILPMEHRTQSKRTLKLLHCVSVGSCFSSIATVAVLSADIGLIGQNRNMKCCSRNLTPRCIRAL